MSLRERAADWCYRAAAWLDPYAQVDHDLVTDPGSVRAMHRDAFVLRGWDRRTRTTTHIYVRADQVSALVREALCMRAVVDALPRRRA